MNHGCVTLDEVFAAAAARAASLVPETSGYLALAIGDASSRLPLSLDERAVLLTTEGSVTLSKRGEVVSPRLAAKAMRDLLARLLSVSSGTMPGLAGAARPRDESDRGVDAVIDEIEAALIPVNRAAARRALARLSRETLRAKEAGKLRARPQATRAAPAKAPEPVAAPVAPPRERTPIPPPELVATPSVPRAPIVEAPVQAQIEHDLAPLLTGLPESVVPPASVERAPVAVSAVHAAPVIEPLPRVVITEPVIALAPVEIAAPIAPALLTPPPVAATPLPEAPIEPSIEPPIEPSIEAAPMTDAPIEAPIDVVAEPASDAPIVDAPPIEASAPELIEAAAPEPPAPFAELAEPTPTVLGMAIEIDDAPTPIDAMPVTTGDPVADEEIGTLEAEAPLAASMPVTTSAPPAEDVMIALPIMSAPAEPPSIVIALPEPPRVELTPLPADELHTLTPIHVIEALPTPIAAEVIVAPLPIAKTPRPILSGPRLPPSSGAPTRADALLASFAFTSGEDTMMTATAVSLKKLALDPTPPPPAARASASGSALFTGLPGMDRHLPSTSPPPVEAQSPLTTIPTPRIQARIRDSSPAPAPSRAEQDELRRALDDETPITRMPAVMPRKGRPGFSVAAAILAGTLAGLFAVARLRPDLVDTLEERIGPALGGSPRSPTPPKPPAPTPAEPPSPVGAR